MIAAIYARKSTAQDVAEDAKSVTRQVEGARAFIAARGWTLDERNIFVDDGVSGALFANRAEFQRMMTGAGASAFEAVVFYDLDRFGRNARQTCWPSTSGVPNGTCSLPESLVSVGIDFTGTLQVA